MRQSFDDRRILEAELIEAQKELKLMFKECFSAIRNALLDKRRIVVKNAPDRVYAPKHEEVVLIDSFNEQLEYIESLKIQLEDY